MALKADNKIFLSWSDVDDAVNKLCDKIRFDQINIDSVHGIPRGGLIPAVLISHKLGLPYVGAVGPNTLVVDDICDSGVTLDKCPGVYTAVLHYKPHTSCFQPTMWAVIHEGNEWLIYPWETKDSKPIQDYLADKEEDYLQSEEFKYFADIVDTETDKEELDHLRDAYYIAGMTNDKKGSFMKFQNKLNNKKDE
jgi:hypoxanthine phosphoribosyltransferase